MLVTLCCVVVAAAPGNGADAVVAARVDGESVLRAELDARVRQRTGDPRAAEAPLGIQAEVIESLVDERLIRAEIKRARIEVGPEEVDKAFEQIRTDLELQGVSMEEFLRRGDRTEQDLRERIKLDIGINRLLAPQLTPAAVEAAFAQRRRDLDGTLVRASHIVLRPPSGPGEEAVSQTLVRADRIRREILRGSLSFAEAAKRYSSGPSRHRGGDVGGFPRHGAMYEEFARQAFALAKGEISRPFVTPSGVHLVMVTVIQPGTVDLFDIRPQVEQLLSQELLRGIVLAARQRVAIEFAPGVAHFDPTTLAGDPANRRIVVEPGLPASTPKGEK